MCGALHANALESQLAEPPSSVAKGNNWDVTTGAAGYRLTLRLAAPAPMRASLPLLAVDGVPIGVARQSPDQRTLTLVTTDPAVLKAQATYELIWSGDVGKSTGRNREPGGRADRRRLAEGASRDRR